MQDDRGVVVDILKINTFENVSALFRAVVSQFQTVEDTARLQILPVQDVAVEKKIGMGEALFGQGDRTAVCVSGSVFQNAVFRRMEMSVEKYVSFLEQGGHVRVERLSRLDEIGRKMRID